MSADALKRAVNFRDLGGHVAVDGRRVKRGVLFRSGALSRLGRSERAALDALGLRTVIDLRTDAEVDKHGVTYSPAGVRVSRIPIDSGDLTSQLAPTILRGDFAAVPPDLLEQVNRQLVRDESGSFRAAIEIVADPSAWPLLFHCTHGKDRAGLLAGITLMALDVPWEAVVADYLRSNDQRTAQSRRQLCWLRVLAPLFARRRVARVELASVERLFIVGPENLSAGRDEMTRRFGSVEGFLSDAIGMDACRCAELRARLLLE